MGGRGLVTRANRLQTQPTTRHASLAQWQSIQRNELEARGFKSLERRVETGWAIRETTPVNESAA